MEREEMEVKGVWWDKQQVESNQLRFISSLWLLKIQPHFKTIISFLDSRGKIFPIVLTVLFVSSLHFKNQHFKNNFNADRWCSCVRYIYISPGVGWLPTASIMPYGCGSFPMCFHSRDHMGPHVELILHGDYGIICISLRKVTCNLCV